jgi:hypothetical protein
MRIFGNSVVRLLAGVQWYYKSDGSLCEEFRL